VRVPILAAALAGLSAGCTEAVSALMPPAEWIKLDTWTTVPDGQRDVRGRVGDVFHLPLGPAMDRSLLGWLKVSINTRPQECPEFHTASEGTSYVFRAQRAGVYHLEVRRETVRRDDSAEPGAAAPEPPAPGTPPPRRDDPSWPPRVWDVTISE
jgi:hypothetical protein